MRGGAAHQCVVMVVVVVVSWLCGVAAHDPRSHPAVATTFTATAQEPQHYIQ